MEEKLKMGSKGYVKYKIDLKYIKDYLSRNELKHPREINLAPLSM